MKSLLPWTTIVLLACLGIVACKKTEPPQPEAAGPEPIRIGEFTCLSGQNASFGQSAHNGAVLAVEQINAAGGILGRPIDLISKDNQSRSGETSTIIRDLISRDKVVLLLGEIASRRSLEAAPIAQASGIPMISPASTNDKVTEAGDFVFRVCFTDSFQGSVLAKFIRSLSVRRVAILTDNSMDYSVGLSESFKRSFTESGGEIVCEQSYSQGDKDFRAQLTAIKAQNPEAVLLPNYYTEAPLVVRQARQIGLDVPFVGGDGWDSPELVTVGGEAMEGSFFSNHFSQESEKPEVREFVKAYREKYHVDPDSLAALAYDSVKIAAKAIEQAGTTDPIPLKNAIAATKDFPGVTGQISLDENRNPTKSAVIIRVEDGKFRYLETVNP